MSEQEFIERDRIEDDIESTHNERLRSADYSDETLYPTDRLEELGRKWLRQIEVPGRSERSKKEATTITHLLAFEVSYRTNRLKELEEALAWEEHDNE